MQKTSLLITVGLISGSLLAACQSTVGTTARPMTFSPPEARGLAFAKARCAACHAVAEGQASPNAEAPAFATVVNAPGLTPASLSGWLRNSHNFPDKMNFTIADREIADLSAYMLTLRDAHYAPPIQ